MDQEWPLRRGLSPILWIRLIWRRSSISIWFSVWRYLCLWWVCACGPKRVWWGRLWLKIVRATALFVCLLRSLLSHCPPRGLLYAVKWRLWNAYIIFIHRGLCIGTCKYGLCFPSTSPRSPTSTDQPLLCKKVFDREKETIIIVSTWDMLGWFCWLLCRNLPYDSCWLYGSTSVQPPTQKPFKKTLCTTRNLLLLFVIISSKEKSGGSSSSAQKKNKKKRKNKYKTNTHTYLLILPSFSQHLAHPHRINNLRRGNLHRQTRHPPPIPSSILPHRDPRHYFLGLPYLDLA